MRILVAEDDQVLADGLLRSLRNAGYAVDRVSSGTEADAALASHEFDLLILDLGLPKLHGLEVLRKLRARGSTVPVLILTAADSVEQRVKGLDLGADDYMAKPFSLQELEARVRALVVEDQEWPVGLFTQTEALLCASQDAGTKVEDAMSCALLCLPLNMPLFRAAALALETRARRILATANRDLHGILSGLDIARVIASFATP